MTEDDIVEPPNFEVPHDELVLEPAEPEPPRDLLVYAAPDEQPLLSLLSSFAVGEPILITMFGYDGQSLPRREAEASAPTLHALYEAVEHAWADYRGHTAQPYVAFPQPQPFARNSIVLLVALQDDLAWWPVVPTDEFLGLSIIELERQEQGHPPNLLQHEQTFTAPIRFAVQDVILKLDLETVCLPVGCRTCDFLFEAREISRESLHDGFSGMTIDTHVGPETYAFDIRHAFTDVETLLEDLRAAQQQGIASRTTLVSHGYRFRPLGQMTTWISMDQDLTLPRLSHAIAAQWNHHPLARARIHRVRALDHYNPDTRTMNLHVLIAFDLTPGHLPCLLLDPGNAQRAIAVAGPAYLPPWTWEIDILHTNIVNPLTPHNFEVFSISGRSLSNAVTSGDVLMYVPVPMPSPEEDEMSLLQSRAYQYLPSLQQNPGKPFKQQCTFESCVMQPKRPPFELFRAPAPASGRNVLELFPLLCSNARYDNIPLPHSEDECKSFLDACAKMPLRADLPSDLLDNCRPIVRAYLETCEPFDHPDAEYHIYTDGSAVKFWNEMHLESDASWAFVVFRVHESKRAFIGWTGGFAMDDAQDKRHIGAGRCDAINAERTALFWAMAWAIGQPTTAQFQFFADNKPACFGTAGYWNYDLQDILATRCREMQLVLTSCHVVEMDHVKAHSNQPQNELADHLAGKISDHAGILAFKDLDAEHCIASFKGCFSLWCQLQAGHSLPPIIQDAFAVLPLQQPQNIPALAKDQDLNWAPKKTQARAQLDITIATYNVLSLKPHDQISADGIPHAFDGKSMFLAAQMITNQLHVLCLQECRGRTDGIYESKDVIRIVASGDESGNYGTEIWLNKQAPIGIHASIKTRFAKNRVFVLHASPRLLIVKYQLPDTALVIVSCHAPQAGAPQADKELWWSSFRKLIAGIRPKDLVFLAGDFNAKIPKSIEGKVGDLLCDQSHPNSPFMLDFLESYDFMAPSTYSELHNGPTATWWHSSGRPSRLDYILIRQQQWDSISSTAWPRLDAGHSVLDHQSVGLRVRKFWSSHWAGTPHKGVDWTKLGQDKNRQWLTKEAAKIPLAPWTTSPTVQVQQLTDSLLELARNAFPLTRGRRSKPYISDSTWCIRQKRQKLAAILRQCRKSTSDHLLAIGFRTLCNASHMQVHQHQYCQILAEIFLVQSFRSTALQLRQSLARDKAAFVSTTAEHANNAAPTDLFRQFACLRKGGRTRKGPEPLPMWKTPEGDPAQSFEERMDIWRRQCQDLEAGKITTPEELWAQAQRKVKQRQKMLPPAQFADFPTFVQLEHRLRSIKRHKAAGNDNIQSDLCVLAAPALTKHLFAVSAKLVTFLEEPLQFKGGSLVAAYKGSGSPEHVTNYRALLMSSHFGKALRSHWRQEAMPILADGSSPLHFGGKKGGNVSHASFFAQQYLRSADKLGCSSSAIFLDISSAYYRVVRELVVNWTTTDEELAHILAHFKLPPDDMHHLQRHLKRHSILQTLDAPARTSAIFDELLNSTWFSVNGDSTIVQTQAGSRPGDNLADIVFSFIYSRLLEMLTQTLQQEGFSTFDHASLPETLKSLHHQNLPRDMLPQLADVTWADDLIVLQHHQDAATLIQRTELCAGLLFDLCWRHGLLPNFKAGKTECLLKLRGKGSKALRLKHFGQANPQLRVPSTSRSDVVLKLVARYRHLGSQIHLGYKLDQEVRARVAQARAAFAKYRKPIFQNTEVNLQIRLRLLNSLVISVLQYNIGTWGPLSTPLWQHFEGAVLGFYRALLRPTVGKDPLQEWSNDRVVSFLKAARPIDLLQAARLRYAGSLWRTAPLSVWCVGHLSGQWFTSLRTALDWLDTHTQGLHDKKAADWRAEHWHEIIPDVKQWKHFIRAALDHAIETTAATEFLHRWHYEFVYHATQQGLQLHQWDLMTQGMLADGVVDTTPHQHACLRCQETFKSHTAWSVHANRKHGIIAPERALIQDTHCEVCARQYHTTTRLLRHLQYSKRCTALLAGRGRPIQAVRPGIGNSHRDRDHALPLPVTTAEQPTGTSWHEITPINLRTDHCPILAEALEQIYLSNRSDSANFDDELSQCLEVILQQIISFRQIVATVDHLQEAYTPGEHQFLHRLNDAGRGAPFWERLAEKLRLEDLVPERSIRASFAAMRGATFAGLHEQRFGSFRWQPSPLCTRIMSRNLVILHFFSGHRRSEDISSFLQDVPSPDGCTVTCVALDIIFDPFRCDLSRSAVQEQWISFVIQGGVLGYIAGPPCESFTSARALGGRAGETKGDGGPRQLRSWLLPFGLPSMRADERKHIGLANKLLLFVYRMSLELLLHPSFYLLEHPAEPEMAAAKDLPSSWCTGPAKLLLSHEDVRLHTFFQGPLGAESPKPTSFMVHGLDTLEGRLCQYAILPMPKKLVMGKTDGVYNTAKLKQYPPLLCRAISESIKDHLQTLWTTSVPHWSPEIAQLREWVAEIQLNQNLAAGMGSDRAGCGA